jgi:hypothetical protein
MQTVDVRLKLTENTFQKLTEIAQSRGVTEEAVIEQALDLMTALDDPATMTDYWFSVAAMREDWEAMPEDWMADEVNHAVSAR